MTDEQKLGALTVGLLTAAMEAAENATYEPEPHLVHPREYAWIKEPVGPAPTWNAIQVALAVGAVTMEHPEARRLMGLVRPPASEGTGPCPHGCTDTAARDCPNHGNTDDGPMNMPTRLAHQHAREQASGEGSDT